VRLGSWDCPTGNNVVVFYRPLGNGLATLEMEWDEPPPLRPPDEIFYLGVIRPAVVRLVTEYTERSGRAVVVDV
jgi:hypothetical protein